jgi:hypothetical protein
LLASPEYLHIAWLYLRSALPSIKVPSYRFRQLEAF